METYAGPEDGVQTIKASEWEPVIRTMAHSEFPSASACVCQVCKSFPDPFSCSKRRFFVPIPFSYKRTEFSILVSDEKKKNNVCPRRDVW